MSALAVFHHIADLHDADGAFGFGDEVFPLLRRVVRKHFIKLPGGDKEDFFREDFLNIVVLDRHVHFRFAEGLVYVADRGFERFQIPFLAGNDLLPVPLIHEDGMDVVRNLIPADGVHIRVESLPVGKTVFFEGIAFPLCQGLYHFRPVVVLLFDAERNRTFIAV